MKKPMKMVKKSPAKKKPSPKQVAMANAILGEEKSAMTMKKAAMKMKKATAMKMKMKVKKK